MSNDIRGFYNMKRVIKTKLDCSLAAKLALLYGAAVALLALPVMTLHPLTVLVTSFDVVILQLPRIVEYFLVQAPRSVANFLGCTLQRYRHHLGLHAGDAGFGIGHVLYSVPHTIPSFALPVQPQCLGWWVCLRCAYSVLPWC
jgi:hypothetical protein